MERTNISALSIIATVVIGALALLPFWPPVGGIVTSAHISDQMAASGIVLTIGGFMVTLLQIYKIRSATDAAAKAVRELERHLDLFRFSKICESCIRAIREIERCNASALSSKTFAMYHLLPERYRELRNLLMEFRTHFASDLCNEQMTAIQRCITRLKTSEGDIYEAWRVVSEDRLPSLKLANTSTQAVHEILIAISAQLERKALEES